ncbi:unnamed protein product [Durusdinium trenchii]|uniref:UDP-glucose 4-epimerase n=1 Tax=Durusdinium trenchii TaxID=1381693 RepID=A0ABP0QD32_9DINO
MIEYKDRRESARTSQQSHAICPAGKGRMCNALIRTPSQQVAVGRRECLSVFGNDYPTPDGTGVRDYIHVDDLAEGHICALEKLFTMDGGCIIHNLGSGTGYSVLEMVKAFEEACGKKIAYKIVDRRPGDLGTVIANAAKAKADFGWQTKRGLKEMCESAWKWQSNNPYGYEDGPGKELCALALCKRK